jgi:hypothetical protein
MNGWLFVYQKLSRPRQLSSNDLLDYQLYSVIEGVMSTRPRRLKHSSESFRAESGKCVEPIVFHPPPWKLT